MMVVRWNGGFLIDGKDFAFETPYTGLAKDFRKECTFPSENHGSRRY